MTRKPLMAGNWKMNLNHVEAVGLVQKLAWTLEDKKHDPAKSEVVVLPPFTDLRTVQTLVEGDRLELALRRPGPVAAPTPAPTPGTSRRRCWSSSAARYVAVGHSERREYHHEDDALVNAKTAQALNRGLTPIICVGEGLEVRKAGEHVPYTLAQVAGVAGRPDRRADDQGRHRVRARLGDRHGRGRDPGGRAGGVRGDPRLASRSTTATAVAEQVRVLYGGSVKANNVASIMAQPDVDGAWSAGRALSVDEFSAIARFYDLPVGSEPDLDGAARSAS